MHKLLNFYCLILFTCIFLISCKEKEDIDPYENSFFYYKNKPFTIDSIKIVNLGYDNGKYTMEATLSGKNNTNIYIKYYSLTGNRYSGCSLNFGEPIQKGNAPGEFTQSSYIMINDTLDHLVDGWIRFNKNDVENRTFEISTSTESDFLMGYYKGEIKYSIIPNIKTIDSIGSGWFTYLNDSISISNGSMYYSGYDNTNHCNVYKLYLTSIIGSGGLQFTIYSPEELKTGEIDGIDEVNLFHGITEQCYSNLFSNLSISNKGISERLQSGNVNITKVGENYIININCTDHYYLKWNPVRCYYKGKLYFTDMNQL